jgi:type II secretory pathway component PulF
MMFRRGVDAATREWLASGSSAADSAWDRVLDRPLLRPRVAIDQLPRLLHQLADGLESGVPAGAVARSVTEGSGPARAVVADLTNAVAAGIPIPAAFAGVPGAVPGHVLAAVDLGSRRGQLPTALRSAAAGLSTDRDTLGAARRALATPLAVLAVLLGATALSAHMFAALLSSQHRALPGAARAVFDAVEVVPIALVPIALVLLVHTMLPRLSLDADWLRSAHHRFALALPGLGAVLRAQALSHTARLLALSLTSGATEATAWHDAATAAGLQPITDACLLRAAAVEEGHPEIVPPLIAELNAALSTGTISGQRPRAALAYAEQQSDRARGAAYRLTQLSEPLAAGGVVLAGVLWAALLLTVTAVGAP